MKDELFVKNVEKLGAFINNLNLLSDTAQREFLLDSIKKASKDIKAGKQVKLNLVKLG